MAAVPPKPKSKLLHYFIYIANTYTLDNYPSDAISVYSSLTCTVPAITNIYILKYV